MNFALLGIHVLLGVLVGIPILMFFGPVAAVSWGAGAGVSLLNLIALNISWPLILAKKLVALAVGVIVFKFAILGWVMYLAVTSQRIEIGWFAGGLSSVVVSVVVTALCIPKESS